MTDRDALVERVAKAMYESRRAGTRADLPNVHLVPWEKYHGRGREYWLALARAAIRAIASAYPVTAPAPEAGG